MIRQFNLKFNILSTIGHNDSRLLDLTATFSHRSPSFKSFLDLLADLWDRKVIIPLKWLLVRDSAICNFDCLWNDYILTILVNI